MYRHLPSTKCGQRSNVIIQKTKGILRFSIIDSFLVPNMHCTHKVSLNLIDGPGLIINSGCTSPSFTALLLYLQQLPFTLTLMTVQSMFYCWFKIFSVTFNPIYACAKVWLFQVFHWKPSLSIFLTDNALITIQFFALDYF